MNDRTPIQSGTVFALALICGTAAFLYTLYTGAPRDRRAYDATASAAMSSRRAIGAMSADFAQPRDRAGLEKAAAENPDQYMILFDLARFAESEGDATASIKYFTTAAEIAGIVEPSDPGYLRATFVAAWSHDRLGHASESRPRFRIAADGYTARVQEGRVQNPRIAYQRIGWCHSRLGESAAAQRAWKNALKILQDRPADSLGPEEHYDLGCLLTLTGNIDAAFVALDAALAKGFAEPEWTRADEDLESLRAEPRFRDLLLRMEERRSRRRAGE